MQKIISNIKLHLEDLIYTTPVWQDGTHDKIFDVC
jgi:hypothetical protein